MEHPPHAYRSYNVAQHEACELVRVALRSPHATPTSRVVAIALRLLKKKCPGLRFVFSFADQGRGHHGGIYQAGGWIYTGFGVSHEIVIAGRSFHHRSIGELCGTVKIDQVRRMFPGARPVECAPRHRYIYPFDDAARAQFLAQALPYPKRTSTNVEVAGIQPGNGGASPTRPLQAP